jgi:cytochrome c oxidase subunit 1
MEVLFQLIPLSLGWIDTIDPGLSRTLFAWTLHPIVYFWLIPAYIAFYVFVPKQAGGFLFSDEMARLAFIVLAVFALPIGFHHLYTTLTRIYYTGCGVCRTFLSNCLDARVAQSG